MFSELFIIRMMGVVLLVMLVVWVVVCVSVFLIDFVVVISRFSVLK